MARIKDSSVDAVKAAVDIVTLVEGYMQLRKSGGRYKGLCPFHQEKTPSFSVSPDRGTFKCFGCGEGGDAISFVEKQENLDFVGAIEFLADRFNVSLEYEETSPEQDRARKRRERLYQLLDRAATFYERYLWEADAAAGARDYLASRGLDTEICKEFRLGLAPERSTLARVAAERGFTRDELAAAGLVNRRGNDYFHGRLLFPLADARGRVVGFQARKLRDDDPLPAKYVNSPEGDLFRKGDLLYGLDLARAAIAKQDRAVVVEGNTDVIALRQTGFVPVVAAMGTALTERQLKELVRLTKRLYLCFDSDAAGQDATLRGMELAAAQGFDIRVVSLPPGSDPADDPHAFEERLRKSEHYYLHRIRVEHVRRDRTQAFDAVRAFLAPIPDSPERQDAERLAADLFGLTRETAVGLAPRGRRLGTGAVSPKLLDRGARLERDAVAGVLAYSELLPALVELGERHFYEQETKQLARALIDRQPLPAPVIAELDALIEREGITKLVAEQLLLRLRERELTREVAAAEGGRRSELLQTIARLREQVERLTLQSAGADPR